MWYEFANKITLSNFVQIIGYIKCYCLSSPTPIKSSGNFSKYICQKICGWITGLKTILGIKKATFLKVVSKPIIFFKFFIDFTHHRKRNNRAIAFSYTSLSNILKYRVYRDDLPTIWKQDSFRQILKSFINMYESSGLQFFINSTRKQSEPDAFKESRSVMTFLTKLGVSGILCSFRLVLGGKTDKEIPISVRLEFLEKISVNKFVL